MPSTDPEPPRVTRRTVLGAAAGTVAAGVVIGVAGCSGGGVSPPRFGRERPTCVRPSALERREEIAGLPLVYEVSRRRSTFRIEPGFATQLDRCLTGVADRGLGGDALWTYGTWTDGGSSCSSWHDVGRAFDLARIRRDGRDVVSCRWDRWRTQTGARLERSLRRYWTVAAALHHDFAYVLTYLYDATHANHVHVDNGRSGSAPSVFDAGSRTQVQAVQAICTHLWARPIEITDRYDTATRRAVGAVLDDLGAPDDLRDPVAWRAFLTASAARPAD